MYGHWRKEGAMGCSASLELLWLYKGESEGSGGWGVGRGG